jgi:NAD(P)-dependent dehydrogenase (short-subunit alcohol dehydrogenase family)
MFDLELNGKTAIVTGASSGIGRQTAKRLAAEGVRVALVARRGEELQEVAAEIKAAGGDALPVPADITVPEDADRCIRDVVAAFGRLDILINAAGILQGGNIENTTLEMWDRTLTLNLRAVFDMIRLAVPHLVESKGCIVNVSSVNGLRSFPNVLAYCVSKAGVDQLTRCVALELAAKGVRVNAINPGVTVTNLHRTGGMGEEAYAKFLEHSKTTHPLGRVGQPDEAADLILFLASARSAWITGTTVNFDGGRGQTCAR